jgi:hypothetical protein
MFSDCPEIVAGSLFTEPAMQARGAQNRDIKYLVHGIKITSVPLVN